MSPTLFNFFINGLIANISALELGIDIDGENVAILTYADDDVALISVTEHDLQMILDPLHNWCIENWLNFNHEKSKIIHFRPPSV